MKITYDPEVDAMYIQFAGEATGVTTQRISEEVAMDFAPDGTVVGIEILDASECVPNIAAMRQIPVEQLTSISA